MEAPPQLLLGCDFSSAPTRRKPVVIAVGAADGTSVRLHGLRQFASLQAWTDWLRDEPSWVGAFDFPFGLPRELVTQLEWPLQWNALVAHYASLDRAEIRRTFAAFCAARPVGGKFAHRATDRPSGSSPSMKWVNPPVAYMLHAGVPRLLEAGAALPGLHMPSPGMARIALEAYPGLLARELIGRRSYKSDDASAQTLEREMARAELVAAIEHGSSRLGLHLVLNNADRARLCSDATGDCIDAALCLVQAAWAAQRRASDGPGFGLPRCIDPLEGWIVTA